MNSVILILYILGLVVYNKQLINNAYVGFWFWMIFFVMYDIVLITPDTIKSGVNITLLDVVFVYFSIVAWMRRGHFVTKNDFYLKSFILSLTFFLAAIPLFVTFNGDLFVRSINGSRAFIIFVPAFLYFFSFQYSEMELNKIINGLFGICIVMGIVGVFLVLETKDRIIPSSGALFIGFGAMFALARYYQSFKLKYLVLSLFLLLMVVVLRHRSVWIGVSLGLIFIHLYVRVNSKVFAIILSAPALILLLLLLLPQTSQKFTAMLDESASPFKSEEQFENSTGGGRVARWKAQIAQKSTWHTLLWGEGHAYNRVVTVKMESGKIFVSKVSFHNHYLEQTFRVGGITTLVLVLFIARFIYLNHQRQRPKHHYLLLGFTACIVATVGFGMMYNFPTVFYSLAGIGYSVLINSYENNSSNSDIQQTQGVKRLTLDAWKHERA